MRKLIDLNTLEKCLIDELQIYSLDVFDVRFNLNYKTGKIVTSISLNKSNGDKRDIHFNIDQLNLCDLGDKTDQDGIDRVISLIRNKAISILEREE